MFIRSLISPGIVVIFLLALFSKKATTLSVLFAAIMSLVLSLFIWYFYPSIPFIDRAGIVFISSGLMAYIIAYLQGYKDNERATNLRIFLFLHPHFSMFPHWS